MLVIISDLHFTDKSSGTPIGAKVFKIFRERITELAYRASQQKGGIYQPIKRIDILLLGDILDLIRSNYWLTNPHNIRPWNDLQEDKAIDVVEEITQRILQDNSEALSIFKKLQQTVSTSSKAANATAKDVRSLESSEQKEVEIQEEDAIWLPVPNSENIPAVRGLEKKQAPNMPATLKEASKRKNMTKQKVEVKIHYMVGNHDWFFHLKGERYNKIRQMVIDAMGLSNKADQPFPHEPEESLELLKILQTHKVLARHGDIYDNFNFEGDRDKTSLGDAVVIELVNRFPQLVLQRYSEKLPFEFTEGLKELDNVRPIFHIPIWIAGLLERTVKEESIRQEVQKLWNEMVNDFMKLDFVRGRDTWSPIDRVDQLQIALKISRLPFETLNNLVLKFQKFLPNDPSSSSFCKHAVREAGLECDDSLYNYVVYGHTHHFEMTPLRVCDAKNGEKVNKLYLNSGTFRSVHDLVTLDERERQFFSHKVMTYLIFYKDDERKGRGFEVWNGALGM